MKFLNSNNNYADFAVKRTRTKGTNRTAEIRSNPFTGEATLTGNSTGTKTYGKGLSDNIKSGRAGMSQLPSDQRVAITPKKATKTGSLLKKAGKFAMRNKIALGLGAAGALGAVGVGVARKMRSDKGRKRGSRS